MGNQLGESAAPRRGARRDEVEFTFGTPITIASWLAPHLAVAILAVAAMFVELLLLGRQRTGLAVGYFLFVTVLVLVFCIVAGMFGYLAYVRVTDKATRIYIAVQFVGLLILVLAVVGGGLLTGTRGYWYFGLIILASGLFWYFRLRKNRATFAQHRDNFDAAP